MEAEWIVYLGIALGALFGGWKVFGKVAAVTESEKDDEVFEKYDPYVKHGVNIAEKFTGRDIDGDGDVGVADEE